MPQGHAAVTVHMKNEQLLLFAFVFDGITKKFI